MSVLQVNSLGAGVLKYHQPSDVDDLIRIYGGSKTIKTNKKIEFFNLPCSFDIETTSFYRDVDGEMKKCAIMYEWTLGIEDFIIIGRTWEEFLYVYEKITEGFNLRPERRLIIYVHNLAFEFQFMSIRLDWEKVFAIEKRKPIQCITKDGVEFRCSLILTGYSLAKLSNQLVKYKVNKLVGDLDYSLIRHSKTPLTDKELGYCINDVRVVIAYIKEQIEKLGNITKLPLTKTGYVRRFTRDNCFYVDKKHTASNKYREYRNLMRELTITPELYQMLKEAFAGGFTHGNANYIGLAVNDVASLDFTSSYPYVMISEKFPMSKFESIQLDSEDQFIHMLLTYCCLFRVRITGLKPKVKYENYISVSHCRKLKDYVNNNGRLVCCEYCELTITEQDFFIIQDMYEWDDLEVFDFHYARKQYLPTSIVKSILDLYGKKTTLKGVEGKESEYMRSKEDVNSEYGMMVTDICRDDILFEMGTWESNQVDIEETIDKYNTSAKRFLYYPWGIWVTAYARANLFTGIMEFADDYLYSDTDSIKGKNYSNHIDYINRYNNSVIKKLTNAMKYHGIDISITAPKNIKGQTKQIGVWDYEGKYDIFKTLGAKRYLVKKGGEYELTVAGLNKAKAVPYLLSMYGDKIFDHFKEGLYIPPTYMKEDKTIDSATGKLTHTYIDERQEGYVEDYKGILGHFEEYGGVHLENADYHLSLSTDFIEYLLGVQYSFR